MKKILILPALLLILACAESKNSNNASTSTSQSETEKKTITAEGKILQVKQGKDGYTAELKSNTGETYFLTISRSNLNNPEQYIMVEIGQTLKISGDYWLLNNEKQITVRKIL